MPAPSFPHQRFASLILLAAAVGLGATGCGDEPPTSLDDDGSPDTVPASRLAFVETSGDAPPLLTTDTSFVATRGEALRVEIFYEDRDDPGTPGDRFLRFELDDESLQRYPEDHPRAGDTFGPGDTITISLRVSPDTLKAEFSPSGLQFDPDEPAELEMRWIEADRDVDDDGEDDPDFEDEVDLWQQESPGDPFTRIGEIKDFERDELRAFLDSFTIFAMAI